MVDMDQLGQKACSELQKEFPTNDVQFLKADITDSEQLVSVSYLLHPWAAWDWRVPDSISLPYL